VVNEPAAATNKNIMQYLLISSLFYFAWAINAMILLKATLKNGQIIPFPKAAILPINK